MYIQELLSVMVEKKASDLHIKTGRPPMLRIHGELQSMDVAPLAAEQVLELAMQVLTEKQKQAFDVKNEFDTAYNWEGVARFRANIFRQRGTLTMVLRVIPARIPSLDELDVPEILKTIVTTERGLILVTGATGSGKSTTLAAMINEINENKHEHIVTIEDPIEFVHPDKKSSICQREVGLDTETFSSALRYVLRQDPDVILIGEMRDTETVRAAISAAETGHMVFSTLHTMDAIQTLDRIIDFFPAEQQAQVRQQLSSGLKAVISQRLVTRSDKPGRIPAAEIMICTPTIRGLIAENRFKQIGTFIKDGEHQGMMSFDQSLVRLYKAGKISKEEALDQSTSPQEIELALKGITSSRSSAQSILSSMNAAQNKEDTARNMDKGISFMRRGMKEEAANEFRKVLRDEPSHREAQHYLSELTGMATQEQSQSAVKQVIRKGLDFYQEDNVDAAIAQWEEALKLDPNNASAKAYIKGARERAEKVEQAKRMIETGAQAYQAGNLLGAIQAWEFALTVDPHNEQAEQYLAEGRKQLKKIEDEKEAKQRFVNGATQYQAGNIADAGVEWSWALLLKPDYNEAQEYLSEAKKYLASLQLEGVDPAAPDAGAIQGAFKAGLDHYASMRFKDAIGMFGQAKTRRPTLALLTEWVERCRAKNREYLDSILARASTALNRNDFIEATAFWKQALKSDPEDKVTLDAMLAAKPRVQGEIEKLNTEGMEYFQANKFREAILCFEQLLNLDPAHANATKRLVESRDKYAKLKSILTQIKS
jgi:twitching motility protein PilT